MREGKPSGYGCQSMVAPLRRLLLAHPRDAFRDQRLVDATWAEQGFVARPDYEGACREYDALAGILAGAVNEIAYVVNGASAPTGLDSIYVHDPAIVSDRGAVLCRMGKAAREREPAAMGALLASLEVPVLGAIVEPGRVEGGDVLWLDARTLAVGQGYRTNAEGIRQLRSLLGDAIDELHVVPLSHWQGPSSCLHLMSFISLVDDDLAVVYSRLMPVPFRELLLARGYTRVEVPDEEYGTLACNVLAVSPRECVMLEGNPRTRGLLERAGAAVSVFPGNEICIKGEGGPTCLTRPLLRR
jgi:N-dimethylarginine dimethylaminohydrolase